MVVVGGVVVVVVVAVVVVEGSFLVVVSTPRRFLISWFHLLTNLIRFKKGEKQQIAFLQSQLFIF